MFDNAGKFVNKQFLFLIAVILLLGSLLVACGSEAATSAPTSPAVTTSVPATTAPATTIAATTQTVTTQPATTAPTTIPATTVAPTTEPMTSPAETPAAMANPPVGLETVNGATPGGPTPTEFSLPAVDGVVPIGGPATKVDFSGDEAFNHVQELAGTIGIRAAGTEGERKAGDYIEKYFKGLGLFTQRPSFDYSITRDQGSTVSYQPAGQAALTIKGNALVLSGSGQVQGTLVDIGLADNPAQFGDLKGKIALVQRGQLTFQQKVDNAVSKGAAAVLIYNNQDGTLESATLQKNAPVPVLGLSQADGEKLKQVLQADKSLSVNVNANVTSNQITMTNVIGVRQAYQGDPQKAPILILCGHYDSVPAGPGANDNASGTAIVMELARDLRLQYPDYELRFIAFSGEEIGLIGSQDYAKKLSQADRQRIKAVINIDMVTVGNDFYVGGTPSLTKLGLAAATKEGAGNVQVIPAGLAGASDHFSFQTLGLPVLFFNRENDPDYHRPGDTVDHVKPERLQQTGRIVIQVIANLTKS